MPEGRRFFAPSAWVDGAWASDVLLASDANGSWTEVRIGCESGARLGAEVLPAPVLPGLVNGHSHAFQRAMAGLAERPAPGQDDFWSWRDRMYAVALRIAPRQLEAVACFLYCELLRAGYTHVCEFHYLHNDADGKPYADPAELSLALVRAAQRAGIGLTLLPSLYMRSGFGADGLRADQRRFASTPASVLGVVEALRPRASPTLALGVALHSLRAVEEGALRETAQAAAGLPVHIHVAEQQREVDDCLRHLGERPIAWLLQHAPVDASWCLVHATRGTPDEWKGVRDRGAGIVLCPSTEANLGDGVFDLPGWLSLKGTWAIGSDSHVTRSWSEELRLLEYSQRLVLRQRNVAARAAGHGSTAAALFEGALAGGAAAAGLSTGALAVGRRADFCMVDPAAPSLAGIPLEHLLDALVFSAPDAPMARVCVAGRDVDLRPTAERFAAVMQSLW